MTPEEQNAASTQSLDRIVAGGVAWTAGAKWATQIVTWSALLIVARLLSKEDYGLGAMAGIYTNLTNVLAEFGIGNAVLHMPELTKKALGQLHAFCCLLCAGIFIAAGVAAPYVADFFHTDKVTFFIVNNIAFLITGFQSVPMGLLQRDMDYRRLSIAEAVSALLQAVVTVVTAWLGWGYWALLTGALSGKTINALLVFFWKPVNLSWPRWADIRRPVEMGRQIAAGRIAWSMYTQADGIVIGRILGEAALGTYGMAMNLASAPAERISTLIMRTASPLFAKVMNDQSLVRRYFLIIVEVMSLTILPVMTGLAFVSTEAAPVILGNKWLPAGSPLRWLALFMIVRTIGTLTEQVLISQLRSRFTMQMSILNFVVMPVAFYAAARFFGVGGVAAAWLVLSPITVFPLVGVLLRIVQLPWAEFGDTLLPGAAGTAAMCAVLFAFTPLMGHWAPIARLIGHVTLGAVVYSAMIMLFFGKRLKRYVHFLGSLRGERSSALVATETTS